MFSVASLMNWVTALSGASEDEIPILSRTVTGFTLANFKPHRVCGTFSRNYSLYFVSVKTIAKEVEF